MKIKAVNREFSIRNPEGKIESASPPVEKLNQLAIQFKVEDAISMVKSLDDKTFSALMWLRRGLSESDHIDGFASLMVCIQILAKQLVKSDKVDQKCKFCGKIYSKGSPSISALVKTLFVEILKFDAKKSEKLWEARNAVIAHGDRAIDGVVLSELLSHKFDALSLAFKAFNLALGVKEENRRMPNQAHFISDPNMYLD